MTQYCLVDYHIDFIETLNEKCNFLTVDNLFSETTNVRRDLLSSTQCVMGK